LENKPEIIFLRTHVCTCCPILHRSCASDTLVRPLIFCRELGPPSALDTWGQPPSAVPKYRPNKKRRPTLFDPDLLLRRCHDRVQKPHHREHRGSQSKATEECADSSGLNCSSVESPLCNSVVDFFRTREDSKQKNNAVRASHPNRMLPHEFHAYPLTPQRAA
jgi:hypothetical protein